ncbi:MAG: Gx transporter family protein [Erysipelotrichaceae bacterium]|nr:Gx transporter family protein [Erysipelotrichaceae bacterium]MDY6035416.1 Gx transporter family protein [Bulleidia sp.]
MRTASVKRFTMLALLSAMAITLNILETSMIPPIMGVFRIGLANIIALIALYMLGIRDMLIVNAMRVVIGNLLTGTIFGSVFWISFAGVILSSITLILMDFMKSSTMFTSVMSSIAHSLGQVLIVSFFYMQPSFVVVLPYFLLLSIPTGLLTGFVAKIAISRVKPLR